MPGKRPQLTIKLSPIPPLLPPSIPPDPPTQPPPDHDRSHPQQSIPTLPLPRAPPSSPNRTSKHPILAPEGWIYPTHNMERMDARSPPSSSPPSSSSSEGYVPPNHPTTRSRSQSFKDTRAKQATRSSKAKRNDPKRPSKVARGSASLDVTNRTVSTAGGEAGPSQLSSTGAKRKRQGPLPPPIPQVLVLPPIPPAAPALPGTGPPYAPFSKLSTPVEILLDADPQYINIRAGAGAHVVCRVACRPPHLTCQFLVNCNKVPSVLRHASALPLSSNFSHISGFRTLLALDETSLREYESLVWIPGYLRPPNDFDCVGALLSIVQGRRIAEEFAALWRVPWGVENLPHLLPVGHLGVLWDILHDPAQTHNRWKIAHNKATDFANFLLIQRGDFSAVSHLSPKRSRIAEWAIVQLDATEFLFHMVHWIVNKVEPGPSVKPVSEGEAQCVPAPPVNCQRDRTTRSPPPENPALPAKDNEVPAPAGVQQVWESENFRALFPETSHHNAQPPTYVPYYSISPATVDPMINAVPLGAQVPPSMRPKWRKFPVPAEAQVEVGVSAPSPSFAWRNSQSSSAINPSLREAPLVQVPHDPIPIVENSVHDWAIFSGYNIPAPGDPIPVSEPSEVAQTIRRNGQVSPLQPYEYQTQMLAQLPSAYFTPQLSHSGPGGAIDPSALTVPYSAPATFVPPNQESMSHIVSGSTQHSEQSSTYGLTEMFHNQHLTASENLANRFGYEEFRRIALANVPASSTNMVTHSQQAGPSITPGSGMSTVPSAELCTPYGNPIGVGSNTGEPDVTCNAQTRLASLARPTLGPAHQFTAQQQNVGLGISFNPPANSQTPTPALGEGFSWQSGWSTPPDDWMRTMNR